MRIFQSGWVRVFTFKTGMLSRVAHDLQLSLGRFEIELDDGEVRGRFWPDTLSVDGVMTDAHLDPSALGASDRSSIAHTLRTKILHTARYPEVRFWGRVVPGAPDPRIDGELEMKGQRRPISVPVRQSAASVAGEVELVPSRWGIEPYKALLGAIKLQDRVVVRFEVTSGAAPP